MNMTVDPADPGVLGVDVGGTKILGISVVGDRIVDRDRVPSQQEGASVVEQIDLVVGRLIERANRMPSGIGIGIAGFVGMDGVAVTAPNTPGLVGVDLAERLGDRYGVPVHINNDANCVAVAAAHDRDVTGGLVAVTIGTGVGGGFMIGRRLLRGHHGFAGEPGHMVVDPNGPKCPCGNSGCWERFASGSGLAWLARRAAGEGRADSIIGAAGSIGAITGRTVTDLLDRGDAAAEAVFGEFTFYLALGIANLIMLLDPEEVVLGGGLTQLGDGLLNPVLECISERFPAAVAHRRTRIAVADLGEEAGAWGAALLTVSESSIDGESL